MSLGGCRSSAGLWIVVFPRYTALHTAYRLMPMALRTAIQLGVTENEKAGCGCFPSAHTLTEMLLCWLLIVIFRATLQTKLRLEQMLAFKLGHSGAFFFSLSLSLLQEIPVVKGHNFVWHVTVIRI